MKIIQTYNLNRNSDLDMYWDAHPFYTTLDGIFADGLFAASRRIGIVENDDNYVLNVELPGFKQSHIDVTVEDETLSVSAKKDGREYKRSVTMPRGVDAEKIEAKLEDGVLYITLPKVPEVKPRKVTIK